MLLFFFFNKGVISAEFNYISVTYLTTLDEIMMSDMFHISDGRFVMLLVFVHHVRNEHCRNGLHITKYK